jgi:magnesium transporter
MLIDAALYIDGLRQDEPSDLASLSAKRRKGFVWIGLANPTESEIRELSNYFELPELAVEDILHGKQMPKLEAFKNLEFFVLKTVFKTETLNDITTGELMILVSDKFVITVRHGEGSPLSNVRADLESRTDFLRLGSWSVVHSIVDKIIDEYSLIANSFDTAIAELESKVFGDGKKSYLEEIYFLKREVIEYRHAIEPLLVPLQKLSSETNRNLKEELHPHFRDLNDHLSRACENSKRLDSLLNAMMQADFTHVQLRQNEDIRKISGWVALTAGPTMVAGIYGMNFENMPELKWEYGYFIIISITAAISAFIYSKLKKSGWL